MNRNLHDEDVRLRGELNALIDEFNDPDGRAVVFNKLVTWVRENDAYLVREHHAQDIISSISAMIRSIILEKFSNSIRLIDIGSTGGVGPPWSMYPEVLNYFVGFDPNEDEEILENGRILKHGIWETDETRRFFVLAQKMGSSLLAPNEEYVRENFDEINQRGNQDLNATWFERSRIVEIMNIPCRSIDSLLANELADTRFNFMKTDVQGADYNIIKGSRTFLETDCVGLQMELMHLPLYRGGILARRVIDELSELGFYLADKEKDFGSFNANADYLFIHKERDAHIASAIWHLYEASYFVRRFVLKRPPENTN